MSMSVYPLRRPLSAFARTRADLACVLLATCALTGCAAMSQPAEGGGSSGSGGGAPAPAATALTTRTGAAPLVVAEAWAVAKPQLGPMPMTAVFARIDNRGPDPVRIVSVSTSASPKAELHQTVGTGSAARMQPVTAFTVDPGVAKVLRPGGDHVMVMEMTKPLAPGDVVTVTLGTADGESSTFTATAKTFTGADEPYAGSSASHS